MKQRILITMVFILFLSSLLFGESADEFIEKAGSLADSGDLAGASALLEKASAEYPDNADIYARWGLYTGQMAGATEDMMEAFAYTTKSFNLLDKALQLDPENMNALLYRGIMGVNVPKFLGRLKGAQNDLEKAVGICTKAPENYPVETLLTSLRFLAIAYENDENPLKALDTWQKIDAMGLDNETGRHAKERIKALQDIAVQEPESPADEESGTPHDDELLKEAEALMDAGEYERSAQILRDLTAKNPDNLEAYKTLALCLEQLSASYDHRIYDDTDYRTALAFEIITVFDSLVRLEPDNYEVRLNRGILSIEMPFFVGRLDQGIEDLDMVIKSGAPEDMKAQALYWTGYAYQKKSTTYWNKVVKDFPESDTAELIFDAMKPRVKHFDAQKAEKPLATISFILGFRDELPPQTAVWIEDKEGRFIKTIYVSGFAGFVKEKQITLSQWAQSSDFADADAITSASIDTGHHIYSWDLRDYEGKPAEKGDYIAKIEVFYWPAMKYQAVDIPFTLGNERKDCIVEKGRLVPWAMLSYYPD